MDAIFSAQSRASPLPLPVFLPGSMAGAAQHRQRASRGASDWSGAGRASSDGDGDGAGAGSLRHGDGRQGDGGVGEQRSDVALSAALATDDLALIDDPAVTDSLLHPSDLLPLPRDGDAGAWAAGDEDLFASLGDLLDLQEIQEAPQEAPLPSIGRSASSAISYTEDAPSTAVPRSPHQEKALSFTDRSASSALGTSQDADTTAPEGPHSKERDDSTFTDNHSPPARDALREESIAAREGILQEEARSSPANGRAPPAEKSFQTRSFQANPGYTSRISEKVSLGFSTWGGIDLSYRGLLREPSVLAGIPRVERLKEAVCALPTGTPSDSDSSAPGPGCAPESSSAPGPASAPSAPGCTGTPCPQGSAVRERLLGLMERNAAMEREAAVALAEAEAQAGTRGAPQGEWGRDRGAVEPRLFSSLQREVLLAIDSLIRGSAMPQAPLLHPHEAHHEALPQNEPQNAAHPPSQTLAPPRPQLSQTRLQTTPQTETSPCTVRPPQSGAPFAPVDTAGILLPAATPVFGGKAAGRQSSQEHPRKEPVPACEKRGSSLADRLAALLDGIQGPEQAEPSQQWEAESDSLQGSRCSPGTDPSRENRRGNGLASGAAVERIPLVGDTARPGLAPSTRASLAALEGHGRSQGTPEASLDSLALLGPRKRRAVLRRTGSRLGPERGAGGSWQVEVLEEEGEAEVPRGGTDGLPYSSSGCGSRGVDLGQGRQREEGALVCAAVPRAMPSLLSAWHGHNRNLLHPYFKKQMQERLMRLATAYSMGESKGSANKQLMKLKRIASPVGNVTERFVHYMLTALQARFAAQKLRERGDVLDGATVVKGAQEHIRKSWCGVAEKAMALALVPPLQGKERVHILVFTVVAVPDWSTLFNALTAAPGAAGVVGVHRSIRVTGVRDGTRVTGVAGPGGVTGAQGGRGRGRRLRSARVTFVVPPVYSGDDEGARAGYRAFCGDVVAAGAARGVPVQASVRFVPSIDFTLPPSALDPRETLVAACWLALQVLPDDKVLRHNPRNTFLKWLREVGATTLVVAEVDVDLNIQFFLPRFGAVLNNAQTVFEAFDQTLQAYAPAAGPGGPSDTYALERFSAVNLINCAACDGLQRFERAETLEKWRERLGTLGFVEAPFSVAYQKDLASFLPHPRSSFLEAQGFLRLRWDGKPQLFVGAWK